MMTTSDAYRITQDNTGEHWRAHQGAGVMPVPGVVLGASTKPPGGLSFLPPKGRRGAAPPFLVETLHKSAHQQDKTVTTARDIDKNLPCESWRSIRGSCSHGSVRWLYVRCKRRDCSGCSKVKQWHYASRIASGIREIGVERCAFIVLTYADSKATDADFKSQAVKQENSFVRWMRSEQKKLGNTSRLEYAKTWELTKSGRLHTNLVVGPWFKIDMKRFRDRWGSRASLEWVKNDQAIAREATKAHSPDGLSTYLTKIEQMVPAAWYRAISFSRGFPKLPVEPPPKRVGEILWESERDLEPGALAAWQYEKANGWWLEVGRGGEFVDLVKREGCDCFLLIEPDDRKSPELVAPG